MLDAMEVEALKEVGTSTGLTGFGAAITSVGFLRCPCHLLAVPPAAVRPQPDRNTCYVDVSSISQTAAR